MGTAKSAGQGASGTAKSAGQGASGTAKSAGQGASGTAKSAGQGASEDARLLVPAHELLAAANFAEILLKAPQLNLCAPGSERGEESQRESEHFGPSAPGAGVRSFSTGAAPAGRRITDRQRSVRGRGMGNALLLTL